MKQLRLRVAHTQAVAGHERIIGDVSPSEFVKVVEAGLPGGFFARPIHIYIIYNALESMFRDLADLRSRQRAIDLRNFFSYVSDI